MQRTVPYADLSGPEILDRARQRFVFDKDLFREYGADEAAQLAMWQKKNSIHSRRPNLGQVQAGCPPALAVWIKKCWADSVVDRPTFKGCLHLLGNSYDGRPCWGKGGSEQKHVLTDGTEMRAVTAAFIKTLPANGVTIFQVERLQNPTLWDMYATKRRTML